MLEEVGYARATVAMKETSDVGRADQHHVWIRGRLLCCMNLARRVVSERGKATIVTRTRPLCKSAAGCSDELFAHS
jgi:tRNA1(Val) A37 N6-methylase TrmN6